MKKTFVTILCTFYVAVQTICATLNDSEATVWENNKNAVASEVEWFGDFQVMVFGHRSGEYCAGLLDGKVVVETYGFYDGADVDDYLLANMLSEYSDTWYEVKAPFEGCRAGVSGDKQTFFIVGKLPSMKPNRSLTIFGNTWRKYNKDRVKL